MCLLERKKEGGRAKNKKKKRVRKVVRSKRCTCAVPKTDKRKGEIGSRRGPKKLNSKLVV